MYETQSKQHYRQVYYSYLFQLFFSLFLMNWMNEWMHWTNKLKRINRNQQENVVEIQPKPRKIQRISQKSWCKYFENTVHFMYNVCALMSIDFWTHWPYVNCISGRTEPLCQLDQILMSIGSARAVTLVLRWCLLKGNFFDPYVNCTPSVGHLPFN